MRSAAQLRLKRKRRAFRSSRANAISSHLHFLVLRVPTPRAGCILHHSRRLFCTISLQLTPQARTLSRPHACMHSHSRRCAPVPIAQPGPTLGILHRVIRCRWVFTSTVGRRHSSAAAAREAVSGPPYIQLISIRSAPLQVQLSRDEWEWKCLPPPAPHPSHPLHADSVLSIPIRLP